jgi:hypothetical protein
MAGMTGRMPDAYWHASFHRLPVGTTLGPARTGRASPSAFDEALERYRPVAALARGDAVFMCDDPQDCDNCGAHCEWLFRVEPVGRVERHDLAWATAIDLVLSEGADDGHPDVVEHARRYWAGEASADPVWEYLAATARVVQVEPY